MSERRRFENLLRDGVPDLIQDAGRVSVGPAAEDAAIRPVLAHRLLEEAFQAFEALERDDRQALPGELADLLAVIERVVALTGLDRHELETLRQHKAKQYGGFEDRWLPGLGDPAPRRLLAGPVQPLGRVLKDRLARCRRAHLAVAFVMTSGFELLADSLRAALARGAEIRLLTTDYLDITEPDALERLIRLPGNLDVRLYREPGRSYHPKAYLFEYDAHGRGVAFIGSSNLSRTALESGVEWNYEVQASDPGWPLGEFVEHFERLFNGPYSVPVTPDLIAKYRARRKPRSLAEEESLLPPPLRPRPAQAEALAQLAALRADGECRALVIAATGIGKTYLAAFDASTAPRVLFIAHREELLVQAGASFRALRPRDRTGFYMGKRRDEQADLLFATVQTLGRQAHLERFAPEHFDYLVVDEFHHAAAKSYQAILAHFRPRFLLGLTATPYRADNRDIFALCDGNVAYRLNFIEAIGFGWLCPFRYFGIYDETDYAAIAWRNNRYDEVALEQALGNRQRAAAVLAAYRKHPGRAALGFCASVRHAEFMSGYFNEQGVAAVTVHSGPETTPRASAIEALTQGAVEILFVVDLFNEGVDIPVIDRVLFLRPTESMTVFLQQFGRGLRLHPGKDRLTVLDFIGNYRKAHYKVALLTGVDDEDIDAASRRAITRARNGTLTDGLPEAIEIDFDLRVIDLMDRLSRARDPLKQRLIAAYREVEADLHRRPELLDIHRHGRYDVRRYRQVFGSWFGLLAAVDALTPAEQTLRDEVGTVLAAIEKTAMTKSYKMVVLESFIAHGGLTQTVGVDTLADDFRRFFTDPRHRRDIAGTSIEALEAVDDATLRAYLETNLLNAWNNASFFRYDATQGMLTYTGPKAASPEAFADAVLQRTRFCLADYFERRFERHNIFNVIHAGADRGIIMLGDDPAARVPRGAGWKLVLIDGERLYAKFAKVAVNVLKDQPTDERSSVNRLTEVLEGWFGKGRYLSEYGNRVRITPVADEIDVWTIEPVRRQRTQDSVR